MKQYRSSFSQPTPTKVLAIFVYFFYIASFAKRLDDTRPPLHLTFFFFWTLDYSFSGVLMSNLDFDGKNGLGGH